jgi:hypothetical protein
MRRLELRSRFAELDLIRSRIDLEEKIALLDNVPIFEADLRQGAADLRAQLNILHGRKLTKELNSRGKTTLHWDGHRDHRRRDRDNLGGGEARRRGPSITPAATRLSAATEIAQVVTIDFTEDLARNDGTTEPASLCVSMCDIFALAKTTD